MNAISKRIFNSFGLDPKRNKKIKHKKNEIAFLHIGKNAGTQVMHVASQLPAYGVVVRKYGHGVNLSDLPVGVKFFFSIRKPETRFFSGFYSRKRKGMPRIYNEWSMHERLAFEAFEHANDLAEALFSDGAKGEVARQAIKSIRHTGMQQYDWFQRCAFFNEQPPLTIIRQEHFQADMQRLLDLVNVDVDIKSLIGTDNVSSHRNDYADIPPLSEAAVANLKKWYIQDYYFYEMCQKWLLAKQP